MSELAKAIAMSGALDTGMLRELSKWKLPGVVVPDEDGFSTPEAAVEAIEEAITGADQVEVRVTDLDVLKNFLQSRKEGKLHVVNDERDTQGTWSITFGTIRRLTHTDYIIPWNSDSIEALLTNGQTYLLDEKKKVYFARITDLYFGDQKAFMLCTPIREGNVKRETKHEV